MKGYEVVQKEDDPVMLVGENGQKYDFNRIPNDFLMEIKIKSGLLSKGDNPDFFGNL